MTFSQYRLLPMGSHPRIADSKGSHDLFGPVNRFLCINYDRAVVCFLACLKVSWRRHCIAVTQSGMNSVVVAQKLDARLCACRSLLTSLDPGTLRKASGRCLSSRTPSMATRSALFATLHHAVATSAFVQHRGECGTAGWRLDDQADAQQGNAVDKGTEVHARGSEVESEVRHWPAGWRSGSVAFCSTAVPCAQRYEQRRHWLLVSGRGPPVPC